MHMGVRATHKFLSSMGELDRAFRDNIACETTHIVNVVHEVSVSCHVQFQTHTIPTFQSYANITLSKYPKHGNM